MARVVDADMSPNVCMREHIFEAPNRPQEVWEGCSEVPFTRSLSHISTKPKTGEPQKRFRDVKSRTLAFVGLRRQTTDEAYSSDGDESVHHEGFIAQIKIKEECLASLVITENNILRRIWTGVIAFLLLYTGTLFPYRLCFLDFHIPDSWPEDDGWKGFEVVIDYLFWIDLILNFFFSYKDKEDHEVLHLKRIFVRYLKSFFLVNLVACIPPDAVVAIVGLFSEDKDNAAVTKGTRLVRLQRASRLARLARLTRLARLAKLVSWIAESEFIRVMAKMRGVRVINGVIGLFWVVHLVGCGWYLCASLHANPLETWVARRAIDADDTRLWTQDGFTQWCHAMYFILTVFFTVGFGDMSAVTVGEIFYVCFTMVIGAVVHSIIMSEIINTLSGLDRFEEEARKRKAMVHDFTKHCSIEPELANTLVAAVDAHTRSNHHRFDVEEMRNVLTGSTLPRSLIGQLGEKVFDGRLVRNRFLLEAALAITKVSGAQRNHQVVPPRLPLLISVAAEIRHLACREVVYLAFDGPWHLYLVLLGVFAYVGLPGDGLRHEAMGPATQALFGGDQKFAAEPATELFPYQLFGPGHFFGECELLTGKPGRLTTARCESDLGGVLLSLHKGDLEKLSEQFPRFAMVWRSFAVHREGRRRRQLQDLTVGRQYRSAAAFCIQKHYRFYTYGTRYEATTPKSRGSITLPSEDPSYLPASSSSSAPRTNSTPTAVFDSNCQEPNPDVRVLRAEMQRELSDVKHLIEDLRRDLGLHASSVRQRELDDSSSQSSDMLDVPEAAVPNLLSLAHPDVDVVSLG